MGCFFRNLHRHSTLAWPLRSWLRPIVPRLTGTLRQTGNLLLRSLQRMLQFLAAIPEQSLHKMGKATCRERVGPGPDCVHRRRARWRERARRHPCRWWPSRWCERARRHPHRWRPSRWHERLRRHPWRPSRCRWRSHWHRHRWRCEGAGATQAKAARGQWHTRGCGCGIATGATRRHQITRAVPLLINLCCPDAGHQLRPDDNFLLAAWTSPRELLGGHA